MSGADDRPASELSPIMSPVSARRHEVPMREAPNPQPVGRPSEGRPIDLVHLATMTVGDRALEREILQLFAGQVETLAPRIMDAGADARGPLVHALKGAACNVGAFGVADAAARLEALPDEGEALSALGTELELVAAFLARLLR